MRGLLLLHLGMVVAELPEWTCETDESSSSVASDTVRFFFPTIGALWELTGLTVFATVVTAAGGGVELLLPLPFAST